MEDSKIIELYWQRKESAISETDSKYGKYCNTIAYNILHNNEDAGECVNDTYLHAWNAIPPKRPNILKAFLAKITRNIALDKYDSQTVKKRNHSMDIAFEELENCIPINSLEEEIEYTMLTNELNHFLGTLSLEKRIIFLERYWYFNSIKNISKKYNQKESSVKMSLLRTRNALKVYLEERGEAYECK